MTRMVKYLIIVTSAVFLLTFIPAQFGWGWPFGYLGLRPYAVTHAVTLFDGVQMPFFWQPATYLFLHAGWFHIIFNLFALWMFGSDLERQWGSNKFLFYFFLTGAGAGLFCVLLEPSNKIPTIGCSGAIFGLLLAYGMLFPDRPIYLYMIVPIKAKWFVVVMGVIELVASYSDATSGVNHVAHLGGMLFGYLYLRGVHLPYRLPLRYDEWRRARLRRKFEVYMRKQEKKDETGRWIN